MDLTQFKDKAKCAICGVFALVIFINATPLCEKCSEHPHDHLPENNYSEHSGFSTRTTISDTTGAASSQTTTSQPSPSSDA